MQIFTKRPGLRWIAPVAVLGVVAGGTLIGTRAEADPGLPSLTAQQLLTKVGQAQVTGLSGQVSETADLGLPSLGQDQNSADFTSLLTGTNELRVAYRGPDQAKIAVQGTFGETDVVRNGADSWSWSSKKNEVVHTHYTGAKQATPDHQMPTPDQAAKQALAAVDKTTSVSVAKDTSVAGRAAYQLVLTPNAAQSGTKINSVRLAVDGKTFVPLQVEVLASNRTVFRTGFTSVDFATPAASEFTFRAPKGAKVTEKTVGTPAKSQRRGVEPAKDAPKVVGQGWTTVVVSKLPAGALSGSPSPSAKNDHGSGSQQLQSALASLPRVSGSWGSGRLLNGTAFSAVLTDDGRVAVGAVEPALLYKALG